MTNKIIKVGGFNVPDNVRKSIKMIVDQMQHHNFAIISDFNAVRVFSLHVPSIYKRNETITIARSKTAKSIITLNPDFRIERLGDFSFKFVLKLKK